MNITSLTCEHCKGVLQIEEKHLAVCPYCNRKYYLSSDDKTIEVNQTINHYHAPPVSPSKNTPTRSYTPGTLNAGITPVAFVSIIVIAIFFVVFYLVYTAHSSSNTDSSVFSNILTTPARSEVESDVAKELLTHIFCKDASSITASDIDSITYLNLQIQTTSNNIDENWVIDYSTDTPDTFVNFLPAQIKTIQFSNPRSSSKEFDLNDVECFTGLVHFSIDPSADVTLNYGVSLNLKNLENLQYFHAPHQISFSPAPIFYDDTKLYHLGLGVDAKSVDFEVLENYPSLQSLSLVLPYSDDVNIDFGSLSKFNQISALEVYSRNKTITFEWLSALTFLKELKLTRLYSEQPFDPTPLFSLSSLETLHLYRDTGLKSIGFVKNMPNLHDFLLEKSDLLSLDELEGHQGLTSLALIRSNSLSNIDALHTLTSLKSLTLLNRDVSLSSFAALTNLTDLYITSNMLSALEGLSLERLHLELLSQDTSLLPLANMHTLQSLTFSEGLICNLSHTEVLQSLSGLRRLELYGSSSLPLPISYEMLFSLPALETLILDDANIVSDANVSLPPNTTLKHFSIYESNFRDRQYNYLDSSQIVTLFSSLHGLESLSAPSLQLESLDFAKDMKKLQFLDMQGNYITDVTPLTNLPELKLLTCYDNIISNITLLPETVYVLK